MLFEIVIVPPLFPMEFDIEIPAFIDYLYSQAGFLASQLPFIEFLKNQEAR